MFVFQGQLINFQWCFLLCFTSLIIGLKKFINTSLCRGHLDRLKSNVFLNLLFDPLRPSLTRYPDFYIYKALSNDKGEDFPGPLREGRPPSFQIFFQYRGESLSGYGRQQQVVNPFLRDPQPGSVWGREGKGSSFGSLSLFIPFSTSLFSFIFCLSQSVFYLLHC